MPLSSDVLTSSSAPAWPTELMALKSPLPSPNVMVPKQSFETRRPVLPSVAYSMMPSSGLSTFVDLHVLKLQNGHRNNAESSSIIASFCFHREGEGSGSSSQQPAHDRAIEHSRRAGRSA